MNNTIVEKLKTESLALRKAKNPIASSITFALSEIEKVGKNNGNRETTEDEAIKVVQKLIATIDENLKLNVDETRKTHLTFEKRVLENVLPQMVSEDEVRAYLSASFVEPPQNKGVAMKVLKTKFGALIDMRRAGEIITEMYGV